MNEYLNPWYILAETGTGTHAIMMHYGNGDEPNAGKRCTDLA